MKHKNAISILAFAGFPLDFVTGLETEAFWIYQPRTKIYRSLSVSKQKHKQYCQKKL